MTVKDTELPNLVFLNIWRFSYEVLSIAGSDLFY